MAKCEHCGNDYDKTIEIKRDGKMHIFDSFERAIHVIAPQCDHLRLSNHWPRRRKRCANVLPRQLRSRKR